VFVLLWKNIVSRKARLFLTAISVVLGTSFLSGTYIFSDTLRVTFDELFSDVFANTDSYVRSSNVVVGALGQEERQLIDASLVKEVLAVPGVRDAQGSLQSFARVIGKDGKPVGSDGPGPPTFGGVISDYKGSLWTIEEGKLPVGPKEVALDAATASKAGYVVGDLVKVTAVSGTRVFTLTGLASYGKVRSPGGSTFALFDPETSSEFLAKPGKFDSVLVVGDGSKTDDELATAIASSLSSTKDLEVLTGAEITAETQGAIAKGLSFFTLFLKIFSYIALGVGSFVIYNVFSVSAAQRRKEMALLRAVGASREQVLAMVLFESFIIGIIGSVLGLFSGVGLSKALSGFLRILGVETPSRGLVVTRDTVITTLIVGTLATFISAILPALRAARTSPLSALQDTALDVTGLGRSRVYSGLGLALSGVALCVLVFTGSPVVLLGLGSLLIFAGVLVLGPVIVVPAVKVLGAPLVKVFGLTGRMAVENTVRNPKRTARTSAPVLIGVALVTAASALAASVKTEVNDLFDKQFTGDYVVSSPARGFGGLSPTVALELGSIDGIDQAAGFGLSFARIDGKDRRVTVLNPATAGGVVDLGMLSGNLADLDADSILVSEKNAKARGLGKGDLMQVTLPDGVQRPLTVAGVYANDELLGGHTLSSVLYDNTSVPRYDAAVYIVLKDNANADVLVKEIQAVLDKAGVGKILSKKEYVKEQSASVDQLLGVIYGLLCLSIVIAVFGIVVTLLLSVYERRREIGMLRAIGMHKAQVRSIVRWESVLTSILGATCGVLMGLGLGYIVVRALREQGLSTFSVSPVTTAAILLLSFLVGVLSAVYPARRATKLNVLEAIAAS
jgi:putative ABC transport system permease protein